MTVEAELAEWISGLQWDSIPPPVQERVEIMLLDAIASALAGRGRDLVRQVEGPARAFGGPGDSTVIGSRPASPVAAAFLNAYAVTAATICDVYRPGLCHVTPVTLPPLLALGEEREAPGVDFLAAFAAGLETTVRLSQALNYREMRSRGWHSPGVVGPLGAAAAGARLLHLDARRTSEALAHAGAQAAGTFAALGTEAVKFNQARAAVSGLLSALVAEAGLSAAPKWLTDEDGGMTTAYTSGANPAAATADIGRRWELDRISLRRWPAASSVQSLIDVCLSLRRDHGVDAATVERVEIELAPSAYQVSGDRGWDDPLSAQQSARWVTAVVLAEGDWWVEHSSPGHIEDPALSAFARERVSVAPTADLDGAAVRVRAVLAEGATLKLGSDHAPGDPERPLERADVEEKLRHATPAAHTAAGADAIIAALRELADAPSVTPFVRALAGEDRP